MNNFILQERTHQEKEVLEKVCLLEEEINQYLMLIHEIDSDEYIELQKEISTFMDTNKDYNCL